MDPPPVLAPGVSSVVVDAGCKPGCRPAVPRGKLSMVESLMLLLLVDMDPVGTAGGRLPGASSTDSVPALFLLKEA